MIARTLVLTISVLGLALPLAESEVAAQAPESSGGKNERKQDQPSGSQGEEVSPGLLAGPQVEPDAEQGRNGGMMSPNNVNRQRANPGANIPLRQWMDAVRSANLTEEQQTEIGSIMTDYQQRLQTFQREHGTTMRRLQQEIRSARQAQRDINPSVREQLSALESEMPKAIETQQQVWDLLSSEQQEIVRARLAEFEARRTETRRRDAGQGSDGQAAPSARPAGGRNNDQPDQGGGSEGLQPSGNGGRNTRKTGEAMQDDQMTPSGGGMTDVPVADPTPAGNQRGRALQRRGAALGSDGDVELDQRARQRLRFLLSRQTAARAGNAATSSEKRFTFEEES